MFQFQGKEASGVAFVATGYFFGGAGNNNIAAVLSAFGSQIDDVVGALDYIEIMLDNDNRVPVADELVKRLHQRVDVVEMETGSRLIKDE